MDVFGETFAVEIHAAGLGGLLFSWNPDDGAFSGRENLTAAQNTTLDAVISAHDPTKLAPMIHPVDERMADPVFAALIEELAAAKGITRDDLVENMKARMP